MSNTPELTEHSDRTPLPDLIWPDPRVADLLPSPDDQRPTSDPAEEADHG